MVYLTGDIHGVSQKIVRFCAGVKPTKDGHTPVYNSSKTIPQENKIRYSSGRINLDCGCAAINYRNNLYRGRLSCLRLEDMKEYYSEI